MKEREYQARYRYDNDPTFHAVVNWLGKCMIEFKLDPNELHDAVNLAGDKTFFERNYRYKPPVSGKENDNGKKYAEHS